MSALDDARAVLVNAFVGTNEEWIARYHNALAALVAECEMWEAVARLGSPVPSPEALDLRHGGGARILNPDEDRSDADGAYALDPEPGVEGE